MGDATHYSLCCIGHTTRRHGQPCRWTATATGSTANGTVSSSPAASRTLYTGRGQHASARAISGPAESGSRRTRCVRQLVHLQCTWCRVGPVGVRKSLLYAACDYSPI